jgi:hypothetical protein
MKYILFHALLFACNFLFAQDYRPFLPGKLHYYSAGNNSFSVRVVTAGVVGGDSAFWLNRVVGPACNPPGTFRHYFKDGFEGRMGDHFIEEAGGAKRIIGQAGDTLTLHTRMPLAASWPFLSGTGLTATLQARAATTTFGVSDTVLAIAVSDGNTFSLSQHFGLLDGPSLDGYLQGLTAVPFQLARQPLPPPSVAEYVTWQPGDAFTTLKGVAIDIVEYNNYTVLNRWANVQQDSLWVEVNRQLTLVIPPDQDTFVYAFVQDTLLYTQRMFAMARVATGELDTLPQPIRVASRWDYATAYGGEVRLLFNNYQLTTPYFGIDTCGLWGMLAAPCDDPLAGQIVEGFGSVSQVYTVGATMTWCATDVARILCYHRVGDSLFCPYWLSQLTGVDAPGIQGRFSIAGSATGQPRLIWEGLVAGSYRISVSDLQGRVLSSTAPSLQESGSQAIDLPGPAGIYLLRVEDLVGGGSWVVRLPRFSH